MSHEQNNYQDLLKEIDLYLSDPESYEQNLRINKKKAFAEIAMGQELPDFEYFSLKSTESRLIQTLTYIKPSDRKPLDIYVDCSSPDKRGVYVSDPPALLPDATLIPSFTSFTAFVTPRKSTLSEALRFPVHAALEVGLHTDPYTEDYFNHYPLPETMPFDFKTTYIIRNEGNKVVKLSTIPFGEYDQREPVFHTENSKFVLSRITQQDKHIMKQYMNHTISRLDEILANKKPLE